VLHATNGKNPDTSRSGFAPLRIDFDWDMQWPVMDATERQANSAKGANYRSRLDATPMKSDARIVGLQLHRHARPNADRSVLTSDESTALRPKRRKSTRKTIKPSVTALTAPGD